MRELNFSEVEEVSGGLAPIAVLGLWIGGGVGVGLGTNWAVNRWF